MSDRSGLQELIERENANWSKIFRAEIEKNSDEKFSSFWWESYYEELTVHVNKVMLENDLTSILEAGSGSGKATILLNGSFQKTLLDISSVALEYAKHVARKFGAENVTYAEGNIFSMPFETESFDVVWNIGVVEHYKPEDIKSVLKEMLRVCRTSGIVAVGVPNLYSGPILKAWLLKWLKFIPGYKLDTEKFYSPSKLESLFREALQESERKALYVKTEYFGNPLIMETPKFILKTAGALISRIFRRNKFLLLVVCKVE